MGRSAGENHLRSYFSEFQNIVDDVKEFVDCLPELGGAAFSSLPIVVFGVSMGGCITVKLLQQNYEPAQGASPFKGACLFAPMLSLERVSKQGLNPYLKPLISVVNKLSPTLRLAKTPKNVMFPKLQDEFEGDGLNDQGYTRVRVANEYLKATDQVLGSMKKITFPFITFHSDDDTFVDPEGSRRLYREAASENKEYVKADGMWHLLLHEENNRALLERTTKWMEDLLAN